MANIIANNNGIFFVNTSEKILHRKGRTLKDSFQNTVYLERGMPYFAFVSTNAVLRMP